MNWFAKHIYETVGELIRFEKYSKIQYKYNIQLSTMMNTSSIRFGRSLLATRRTFTSSSVALKNPTVFFDIGEYLSFNYNCMIVYCVY
jgi:hypothetical protein